MMIALRVSISTVVLSCAMHVVASTTALHQFGDSHTDITWHPTGPSASRKDRFLRDPAALLQVSTLARDQACLTIMHITDSHIGLHDDDPPRTTRMYNAFHQTKNAVTGKRTSPQEQFSSLLQKARDENVDLVTLGGDIVNYPSKETVAWVVNELKGSGDQKPLRYMYTSGNHDWHKEGVLTDTRYDSSRERELHSTLAPLFDQSLLFQEQAGASKLFGNLEIKGVDMMYVDNSNHQVNEEQLAFAKKTLEDPSRRDKPAVLLLHMPLALPGVELEPKYECGNPTWGAASDALFEVENRPQWPAEGNLPSTGAFIELVQQHSAPTGRIVSLLTGHVHRDFHNALESKSATKNVTALVCQEGHGCQAPMALPQVSDSNGMFSVLQTHSAQGALQYATLDAAEGGYRMVTIKSHGEVGGMCAGSAPRTDK